MNIKKIKITKVEQEDIETISEIAVNAWEKIHEGYRSSIGADDLYNRISQDWRKKKFDSITYKAEKEPENVLVAKDIDGKIMGFATLDKINLETGIGEIGNNAVLPEFQGNGVGKMLHEKILELCRQRGLLYATVSTGYEDEGHAAARAAYEKTGFTKMKTSITYSIKL